LTAQGDKVIY